MSELRGLRGRLTLALLAASALTLVITSVLLLFPLDRKLRQDVRNSTVATARATRPGLLALEPASLTPGSKTLRRVAHELRKRTGLDVAVFDASGRRLVATDVDGRDHFPEVKQALATSQLVSRFGRGDGEAQAQVALPIRTSQTRFAVSFRRSLRDLNGAQDVVRRSLIAAAFVALGVALVAGIVLATRLARRVTALRDVALAVADQGPGSRIVEDGGRDEIGDLARAFATMQHRLDDQERSRRTFVSTASHELRTPLASLRLMLHAADEELAVPAPDLEEARRQVTKALGQSVRLGRLSEELLDLSRLDAGVELRVEPVDLAEVARSVLAEFDLGDDAPQAGLGLVTDRAAWASADPGGVARILRILVDNALRHTPPDGQVAVRVDGSSIEVADTGPGVPEKDADRIFRRFERGPETRDDGGFGLGLAIGHEVARQMGGDLRLRRPGPGANFVASFPPHDARDA